MRHSEPIAIARPFLEPERARKPENDENVNALVITAAQQQSESTSKSPLREFSNDRRWATGKNKTRAHPAAELFAASNSDGLKASITYTEQGTCDHQHGLKKCVAELLVARFVAKQDHVKQTLRRQCRRHYAYRRTERLLT